MVREDRKDKKTVHITKDLHYLVKNYMSWKEMGSVERTVDLLIREGFKNLDRKGELPEHIKEKLEELEENTLEAV